MVLYTSVNPTPELAAAWVNIQFGVLGEDDMACGRTIHPDQQEPHENRVALLRRSGPSSPEPARGAALRVRAPL